MKFQIKEFADICGITVRTLHYYDEIGLLKPASVDMQNGYRWYDEKSFQRMQEILFFRELDFSLKAIGNILDSPDYDRREVYGKQKNLLLAKRNHLEKMIAILDAAEKGEEIGHMDFYRSSDYETVRCKYAEEVKKRWGDTDAYGEYTEKTRGYAVSEWSAAADGLDVIFKRFAERMKEGCLPEDNGVQRIVSDLKSYITEHFYTCSNEILSGLGEMYCVDDRFRSNINRWAEGTAEFAADAIRYYTSCC